MTLKRGKPLKRTELKRGTSQLKTTKRMKQKRATPRRQTRDETIADPDAENDWSPETRRTIRLRSGGMCELKCNRIADSMHHRKLREHGDHRPENGLHLCRACHAWIHHNPMDSYERGWLVRSTLDPALVKVELGPFEVPT
jgi:hypothetical protein